MLSVAMIVKNEESNLRRCLESVKNVADELVIVDTGSTDATISIAKEYTDKVFEHPWENSFAIARNQSIQYCTGDWIFIMDADEELPLETQNEMKAFLATLPDDVNTVYMTGINWLDFEKTLNDTVQNARIFRKGTVSYVNRVHNQPVSSGKSAYFPKPLYHYGYIWDDTLREQKHARSKTLIVEQLKDAQSVKLRHYYEVQLYKTELIGNYPDEAYEYGKEIFAGLKNQDREHLPVIAYEFFVLMAFQALDFDEFEFSKESAQKAISIDETCSDAYMALALYQLNVNDIVNGIETVNKFFKIYPKMLANLKQYQYTVTSPKYIDIMCMASSMLYAKFGKTQQALDYLKKVNFEGMLKKELQRLAYQYTKILTKEIPEKMAAKIFAILEPHTAGFNISPLEHRLDKAGFKVTNRKKIAIVCQEGLDTFVRPIFEQLNKDYICRLLLPQSAEDIRRTMDWADIMWFEWANQMSAACINEEKKSGQKWILRTHSYEVLGGLVSQIKWGKVDCPVFVAEHALETAQKIVTIENPVIIHNGLDATKFNYLDRQDGFNIAFDGNMNYKKNPEMLVQIMEKLIKIDKRYKFFWAGNYDDLRTLLYMEHIIKELGMQENFFFEKWQDNVDTWLEDKNYYLSTSILETYGYSIVEAMAKGIKPIVHNFYGAKEYYDQEYLFNTIDEAVNMIINKDYNSKKYREFAEQKSFTEQMNQIKSMIEGVK